MLTELGEHGNPADVVESVGEVRIGEALQEVGSGQQRGDW